MELDKELMLRMEALNQAMSASGGDPSASGGDPPDKEVIVAYAEAFYQFLSTTTPEVKRDGLVSFDGGRAN